MAILFEDLYHEELTQKKEISFSFWFHLIWDVIVSTLKEHKQLLQKIGLKKYFSVAFSPNTFIFLLSLILLSPFLFLMSMDFGSVLLTGNREAMSFFYDSPYWNVPVILTVVLILPLIAVLINGFVLVKSASKNNYHFLTASFIGRNFFNLFVFW